MRKSLQKIVAEFEAQADSIKRQLALVEYLVRGFPALAGLPISKTQAKNMAIIAKSLNSYISNDMRAAIQNGSIIIAAAFFEEAIRKLVRDCLVTMSHKKKYFHELAIPVQKSQISSFGTRFLEIKNPTDLFQLEIVTHLENMLACARKAEGYVLLAADISKNKNNMRSGELTELCGRVGVSAVWERVSKKKRIQDFFGQYNPKFVMHESTVRLNGFIETRNSLIHLDPSANTYGRAWIESEVEFLAAITQSVAGVFDQHLRGL